MILSSGGRGRMESEDKRRIRDMEETIRMKNKQIHQLLEDVEEVLILKDEFNCFLETYIQTYVNALILDMR